MNHKQNAERYFAEELATIQNKEIKEFVLDVFDKFTPDCFWAVPYSTSGKYHPQVSLGVGGLVRHIKLVVWWGLELLRAWPNTPEEVNDEVIAALILHDLLKNGCGFNTSNHGIGLWWALVKRYGTDNPRKHRIMVAIRDHMGKWTEDFKKDSDDIVDNILSGHIICITTHLADYCASRKVDAEMLKLNELVIRKYPCPKCETGELYDANAGGMFAAQIECDNPDCDYNDFDICGCVTG